MRISPIKVTNLFIAVLALVNVNVTSASVPVGYYSDKINDRVIAFNPRTMDVLNIISTNGASPYPIDNAGDKQVYVTTRASKSLDVIDKESMQLVETIHLSHYPRSVTYNSTNKLAIVSGVRKPVTSVIETQTNRVVGVVGEEMLARPTGFGGGLATGHPFWLTEDKFLLLDREKRKIDLYRVNKLGTDNYTVDYLYTLDVPSSVHHIMSVPKATGFQKDLFYAVAEGAPKEGIAPAIVAFELSGDQLYHSNTLFLSSDEETVGGMGAHHASFHPDGVHIYVGSNEGQTFVVNRTEMRVVNTIETGKGNGHTTMIPGRMLAVSTNHSDTFMTVIDLNTHKKLTDIEVSQLSASASNKTQSHTSSFDPKNDRYFYTAASNDGSILEIDLETLSVSRQITLNGSYPIQGVYVW
ncbi:hypothetical protein [Enterovibrio calviensis]|uniref:hypothetical protein n=1 Tax=Enterovibrio calviensis TaxID=91359 RepID=UPI003736A082